MNQGYQPTIKLNTVPEPPAAPQFEKLANVFFVMHNGMRFDLYGYKLSDAKTLIARFNSSKNKPEHSSVLTYESPDDPSRSIAIDLKNVVAIGCQ